MRAWLRVGLLVAALGSADGVSAQDALTQRDGQGAVTVVVTLAGLPEVGVPIRATVVLDTHTWRWMTSCSTRGGPSDARGCRGRADQGGGVEGAAAITARRSWCFRRSPSRGRCASS